MLVRLGRQVGTATWRRTSGKPVKRGIAVATGLAMVGGLAWAWWPNPDTYRPIQPDERGTVTDLVRPVAAQAPGVLPTTTSTTASAPTPYAVGDRGSVQTVWDGGADADVPTEGEPQLAVIAQPSEGSPEADAGEQPEAWVFPFDQPLAPEPGDNQALAVATEDGTVTYDVALALVWVEDGEAALNTNEAYAFASCDTCAAVSVAFQVVFVVGRQRRRGAAEPRRRGQLRLRQLPDVRAGAAAVHHPRRAAVGGGDGAARRRSGRSWRRSARTSPRSRSTRSRTGSTSSRRRSWR